MTYDDLMDGRQERFEREDAAELHRVQREAGRAFAAVAATPVRQGRRAPALSAERRVQVAFAAAVVAALGGMEYGQVLGGRR